MRALLVALLCAGCLANAPSGHDAAGADCGPERERPTGTNGPHGAYTTPDWSLQTLRYNITRGPFEVILSAPVSDGASVADWTEAFRAAGADVDDGLRVTGSSWHAEACIVLASPDPCCEQYLHHTWTPGDARNATVELVSGTATVTATYTAASHHCRTQGTWSLDATPGLNHVPHGVQSLCT